MTISTASSSTSRPIANPDDLARRVAAAAEEENVLRVKGFVEVGGKPMRLLVQAVGPRVNHYYDRAWTAAGRPPLAAGGDRPEGPEPAGDRKDPRRLSGDSEPCTS